MFISVPPPFSSPSLSLSPTRPLSLTPSSPFLSSLSCICLSRTFRLMRARFRGPLSFSECRREPYVFSAPLRRCFCSRPRLPCGVACLDFSLFSALCYRVLASVEASPRTSCKICFCNPPSVWSLFIYTYLHTHSRAHSHTHVHARPQ